MRQRHRATYPYQPNCGQNHLILFCSDFIFCSQKTYPRTVFPQIVSSFKLFPRSKTLLNFFPPSISFPILGNYFRKIGTAKNDDRKLAYFFHKNVKVIIKWKFIFKNTYLIIMWLCILADLKYAIIPWGSSMMYSQCTSLTDRTVWTKEKSNGSDQKYSRLR